MFRRVLLRSGKDLATIEHAMESDKFMSAEEAQEFGIIDAVMEKRPLAPEGDAIAA